MKTVFTTSLDEKQRDQWMQFWRECKHTHLQQHPLFGEIERARGRTLLYAMTKADGQVGAIGVFSLRNFLLGHSLTLEAACLRGPAFDDIDYGRKCLQDVRDYFGARRVGKVRLCPYWLYPEAEAVTDLLAELGFCPEGVCNTKPCQVSPTGIIDISMHSDEFFAGLRSKTRQEIRRASRLGVIMRTPVNLAEAEVFFRFLNEMHRQRSLIPISLSECRATYEYILKNEDLGVLFCAYYKTQFLGGLWLFRGTNICHYSRYVITRPELRKLSNLTIAPALWWRGIQWAKEKQCRWVDVEGYEENVQPYHPKYRLSRIKKTFNPRPVLRVAPHFYICNLSLHRVNQAGALCLRTLRFGRALPYRTSKKWKMLKGNRKNNKAESKQNN